MADYSLLKSGVTAKGLPGKPDDYAPKGQPASTKLRSHADLRFQFLTLWRNIGPPGHLLDFVPVSEFRFHPTRRWKFDVAWPGPKVAVELEGGIFIQGRHTRGNQYRADCEKYRAAVALGWRLLRFTANDLREKPLQMIEEVRRVLET